MRFSAGKIEVTEELAVSGMNPSCMIAGVNIIKGEVGEEDSEEENSGTELFHAWKK
jgi:hypothetical protein